MAFLNQLESLILKDETISREKALFNSALNLISECKEEQALEQLKGIYIHTHDDILKSVCAQLLFDFFFAKSDWTSIQKLGLLNDLNIDESNRYIARACSEHEPVSFSLPLTRTQVHMKESISGCPTIEVSINGENKHLWLDTGAGMTVISKSLANSCHIETLGKAGLQAFNSTSQNLQTDMAFIDSIQIDHLLIHNQPSLVLDDDLLTIQNPKLNKSMVIDGIIGWDVIQHFHLEIDYKEKQVSFQQPIKDDQQEPNLFFAGAPIIKAASTKGTPLFLGLDTGANKTHFCPPLLSKIEGLQVNNKKVYAGGVGDMQERELKSLETLIVHIRNQSKKLNHVRESLNEFAKFHVDGVLGSDIAKEGRLCIDYPNRYVSLK